MSNFGVELDSVDGFLVVGDSSERSGFSSCDDGETFGEGV